MYTPYQSGYFAHWLTLEGRGDQRLTRTLAGAKVDMNPHQVDAALFALRSPLSRGVILADEVGLGKTIEASLVLAQHWAEQKRKLLLIVPATLRMQWRMELEEKFALPSVILEARSFNQAGRQGAENPFDVKSAFGEHKLVICSYEFAARKSMDVGRVPWDLVVFDEAHKLRGIYKKEGSKTARVLTDALDGRRKLLLSATPLQNNLLELYGLVSVIDPHFFGDIDSFRVRYARPRLGAAELALLRARLQTIATRTLRRQVQEEGGINFVRRYSMTEDFRPTEPELELYREVSAYLQREDLHSIKPGARHLVTLVIRKILASSSYAIQGTFQTMVERLEKRLSLADALSDYDALPDLEDAAEVEDEELVDPEALKAEIDQLKGFQNLAAAISGNAKADALLCVLTRAFEFAERLGGARKAVIFTESVRTQSWLFGLLSGNGYAGRIVLLNGSNNDETSKQIYHEWLSRHRGSSRISNSKTADMKSALVDRFREDAEIMICTEAGAEGINLQFCSLLINYDLPWNPQRVEQRIGRVHRYGQKHDVVVVNFINKGNRADERVFELLSEKFRLFEGVFGASDEILGAIESGVDIQWRINDIYQRCRTDEQIEEEFNRLPEQLSDQLETQARETRQSLFEHFDLEVVKRLNLRREQTQDELGEYQQMLLRLAWAELTDARFDAHRFLHGGQWYDLNWQEADATDASFFRPVSGLGLRLIEEAKTRLPGLGTAVVELDYSALGAAHFSDVRNRIGQSGELVVELLDFVTPKQTVQHLLISACTDGAEWLPRETAERLLLVPGRVVGPLDGIRHLALLREQLDGQEAVSRQSAEEENERYFEEESEKLEHWAEDRRVALDLRIKQLDEEIRELRKIARQLPTLKEKMEAKRVLKEKERQRDRAMLDYHEEKKRIEQEEDRLLEEIESLLRISTERRRLFAIRWILREKA